MSHAKHFAISPKTIRTLVILSSVVLLVGLWWPQPAHASGSVYYIGNQSGVTCSDSYATTSATAPWCDFANVNTHTFVAGDQILLGRGSAWNTATSSALLLHGSGTSWSSPITVDAYGTGPVPLIRGNDQASDRTVILPSNPNYWSISDLELSHAGEGIIADYTTLGNQGLRFSNLYVHDINTIFHGSPQQSDYSIYNSAAISIGFSAPPVPNSSQWVVNDIQITNLQTTNTNGVYIGTPATSGSQYSTYPPTSIQQVRITNCTFSNEPAPTLALITISHALILDNRFDFSGHQEEAQGTTGIYLWRTSNMTFANNTLENMNNTNDHDETAADNEGYVSNSIYEGNYFAHNAGAGTEFLALAGRSGDYSTGHVVQDNAFSNNATASGTDANGSQGSLTFYNQTGETMTGTAANNLYYEPTGFSTVGTGATNWSFTNNQSVASASNLYNAADGFSGTQGQGQWSYQAYNGGWSNLNYDGTNNRWGNDASFISRFDELPQACSGGCWTARTWTAPSTGTIDIRGWVIKNDSSGGPGVLARITQNDTTIWPQSDSYQTIAGTDQVGDETALSSLAVTAGDVIRFQIASAGSSDNTDTLTSWSPSIAYVSGGPSGTYKVVNQQNNLCLQLNNNANTNGTAIVQWECDQGTTNQWSFTDQGNGQYEIVEQSSGKCLQLNNSGSDNGTQAVLWECDQGSAKLWLLSTQSNGSYEIVNASSNKCLQIDNNSIVNGANVVLWQCDQGTEKFWSLA